MLTLPDLSVHELKPFNDSLQFTWEKEQDQIFFRLKLNTAFFLKNDPKLGITDFDTLRTIEEGSEKCDRMPLEIKILCSGSYQTFWTGFLNLTQGRWNKDRCTLLITPVLDDDYSCLKKFWEIEKNLLNVVTKITAEPYFGNVVKKTCDVILPASGLGPQDSCLADPSADWVLVQHLEREVPPDYRYITIWAREEATTTCSGGVPVPPPGDGWTLRADNCGTTNTADYTRPVPVIYNAEASELQAGDIEREIYDIILDGLELDNGMLLEDILDFFEDEFSCGWSFVSDFFSINPDMTAPANAAYTSALSNLQNLAVWQKSDVKRADAASNATKAIISFQRFLEMLRDQMQVYLSISGSTFRLEHISYYAGSNGLDISGRQEIEGLHDYTYDTDDLPVRERWEFSDNMDRDFRGVPIEYDNACTDQDDPQEKVFQLSEVNNDVEFIVGSDEEVSDAGFVFANLYYNGSTYSLVQETNAWTGNLKLNGHMSMPNLHENYWRHYRPFLEGEMNEAAETFTTAKKTKAQVSLRTTICCDDLLTFDPNDLINTQIGWGEVRRAVFVSKGNVFTLDINHD